MFHRSTYTGKCTFEDRPVKALVVKSLENKLSLGDIYPKTNWNSECCPSRLFIIHLNHLEQTVTYAMNLPFLQLKTHQTSYARNNVSDSLILLLFFFHFNFH